MGEFPPGSAFEALLIEREINKQLWTYGRACDERNWPAFENVFTEDATADYGSHTQENSRTQIIAFLKRCLDAAGPTQHFFGGHFLEAIGDTITSRASVRAFHQGKGARSTLSLVVYGSYDLSWRRNSDLWRMSKLVFRAHAETGSREILDGAW